MNTKNLWISTISAALLTTLVSNVPFINLINCLIFSGFWGSAIFGVWLYRRLTGSVTMGEALRVGALTGLLAGLMGLALSFAGLAGLQGWLNGARLFIQPEDLQDVEEIPVWASLLFNLVGVVFNIIFGTLGGWLGGMLFKPKAQFTTTVGSQPGV